MHDYHLELVPLCLFAMPPEVNELFDTWVMQYFIAKFFKDGEKHEKCPGFCMNNIDVSIFTREEWNLPNKLSCCKIYKCRGICQCEMELFFRFT